MLPFSSNRHLRAACSKANLARAWLWITTSPDGAYKLYFRDLYRAYALGAPSNIVDLRSRLLAGTFTPTLATKLYFPKPSGIQRPYSLLAVEDQVAYQAMVNVVAERLYTRAHQRYRRTVFGHLYAGRRSTWFYEDWRRCYRLYTQAMKRAFDDGYRFTASFDLTACYDSIDHKVLTHFLEDLGLDREFASGLSDLLSHWTSSATRGQPIYHGHGIPQGPLPSGLLAEVVLRHFDDTEKRKHLRYFRYVDDIRLFAKDEDSLRREIVRLDLRSKDIGLFPQAAKVDIHAVVEIESELKSLSAPSEFAVVRKPTNQIHVRKRLKQLTKRLAVANPTRFKFVLAAALPQSALSLRLLMLVRRHPHLYDSVFRYLAKARLLSKGVSRAVVDLLYHHDVYPAFSAALLRAVDHSLHPVQRPRLYRFCRSRLSGQGNTENPELRAAAAGVLIHNGQATWAQTLFNVRWRRSWWVRAALVSRVRDDLVGRPSYESLIHELMRDTSMDVALAATELCLRMRLAVPKPLGGVHHLSQCALRGAGRIGRLTSVRCPIATSFVAVLGPAVGAVSWRTMFSSKNYRLMISRAVVWQAYSATDATAWVALTDTINDILLATLFAHDKTLGGYAIGNIGAVLQPSSRFASSFPKMYRAADIIHKLRLEADLSHPVTKATSKPTRRILYGETHRLKKLLIAGYRELWSSW
jgi:hypothetical protein